MDRYETYVEKGYWEAGYAQDVTFRWEADYGSNRSTTIRVLRAQFGDGYSQRVKDGANVRNDDLNLTFTRSPEVVKEIDSFLELYSGTRAFTIHIPGTNEEVLVTCDSWQINYENYGNWKLSATFKREYG